MLTSEDLPSAEQFKIGILTYLQILVNCAEMTPQRSAESYKKYKDHSANPPQKVLFAD